jgi:hypothetical protein
MSPTHRELAAVVGDDDVRQLEEARREEEDRQVLDYIEICVEHHIVRIEANTITQEYARLVTAPAPGVSTISWKTFTHVVGEDSF